jgi:hypothetical protein
VPAPTYIAREILSRKEGGVRSSLSVLQTALQNGTFVNKEDSASLRMVSEEKHIEEAVNCDAQTSLLASFPHNNLRRVFVRLDVSRRQIPFPPEGICCAAQQQETPVLLD